MRHSRAKQLRKIAATKPLDFQSGFCANGQYIHGSHRGMYLTLKRNYSKIKLA